MTWLAESQFIPVILGADDITGGEVWVGTDDLNAEIDRSFVGVSSIFEEFSGTQEERTKVKLKMIMVWILIVFISNFC
ncbi:MAG: hypothetical protein A2Z71_02355 [Chloroflexi bacterium RBG_13_50_21]|nr:MAG: hypothetical protein A2Z71_02355 [Chloroflexi bacterium RBG_13_50_21]